MITREAHIRHWTICFIFSFDARNAEYIEDALIWADAPESITERVRANVLAERPDEGFTFSQPSVRRSVAAVGKTSSGPEVLNTTVHEITHIAQHIAAEDGINPYSEEFAYIVGDITIQISDIVCELSCPHCHNRHD